MSGAEASVGMKSCLGLWVYRGTSLIRNCPPPRAMIGPRATIGRHLVWRADFGVGV